MFVLGIGVDETAAAPVDGVLLVGLFKINAYFKWCWVVLVWDNFCDIISFSGLFLMHGHLVVGIWGFWFGFGLLLHGSVHACHCNARPSIFVLVLL